MKAHVELSFDIIGDTPDIIYHLKSFINAIRDEGITVNVNIDTDKAVEP